MTASTARRLAHGLWLATALLWVGSLVLILIDQPSEAVFWLLLAVPTATYATVGALVARRRPKNPIGWLFCAVALSLVLWMFALAYAQAGRGGRGGISTLPGAHAAAWIGVLSPFVVVPVALPIFLLFFPDGHLRSRRWRAALAAIVLGCALMVVGVIGQIYQYSGTIPLTPPGWATRIPGIDWSIATGLALTVGGAFAALVSLVLRFRSATPDERQPLRLLVIMLVAMAVATAIAVVTAPLVSVVGDWLWITIALAILVDGFGVLIGIPLATTAAVLTYGLYDVGVVMKKTVVYVLLVIFFVILLGLLSLMLSPLAFIGTDTGEAVGRDVIVTRILTGVAVFALVLVFLFRPVKRLAKRLVYGRRATPSEAMAEFSERLGEAYSTEDVLPRMAEIVRASTGADVARVWLRVGGELRPVAAAPSSAPAAAVIDCTRDELPDMAGLRAFHVRDRAELLGALTVAMPAAEPLSKNGEKLVTDLASQAGLVLRNVRLIEELQESRRRIVAAQDERARKLERDIHDGAQQQLVALTVKLRLARGLVVKDPTRAEVMLGELHAESQSALEDLR
ncbi:MAG: histidine kinase, partial [Actinomycetota bacterium]